ncbi:MAG: hypothetical protein PHF31_16015, partial [Methylobacter sp.]|nr:hypothetical protein [Methylobacter sp.]
MAALNAALHRSGILNAYLTYIWRKSCAIQVRLLFSLALVLFASTALAQTPVSDAIAVNTHWTVANSP